MPSEPSRASEFNYLLSNSPKRSPWFLPGYEGKENMFYFLIQLSFVPHDLSFRRYFV